jgi:hypothetical protein
MKHKGPQMKCNLEVELLQYLSSNYATDP